MSTLDSVEASPKTEGTATLFTSGTSDEPKLEASIRTSVSIAARSLQERKLTADLVLVFVASRSEDKQDDKLDRIFPMIRKYMAFQRVLSDKTIIIGCTSGSISGTDKCANVSIALASLPHAQITPFTIPEQQELNLDWRQSDWRNLVGIKGDPHEKESLLFLLFQSPDYSRSNELLSGLDFAFPRSVKVGAVAGSTNALHRSGMIDIDGSVKTDGVVGLSIAGDGNVDFEAVVAQGARGVGPKLEVVAVNDENEITRVRELATQTEAQAAPMLLFDMWNTLNQISETDKILASKYLLLGVEVEARKGDKTKEGEVGKVVVRKVLGFNNETQSIAVDGPIRIGQAVQFQVRDEKAALDELDILFKRASLEAAAKLSDGLRPVGVLMFVDSERGENLYGELNKGADVELFAQRFGANLPLLALGCGSGQFSPLPTPGYRAFFPIAGVGLGGSTFRHSASAVYLILYAK